MQTHRIIGDTEIQPRHRATCHCGRVVLELELPEGVQNPRRCNCSICSRRGAVTSSIPVEKLHVVQGEEFLTLYEFNTKIAKHFFCRVCGIYTHHVMRGETQTVGLNMACIDGFDIFALSEVPVGNGKDEWSVVSGGGAA